MRSTLMTSAPNQASIWVQAGPAWTPVKSITVIPASGLSLIMVSFSWIISLRWWGVGGEGRSLLRRRDGADGEALRVEVRDVAAFGAGRGVDHAVDERRAARGQ